MLSEQSVDDGTWKAECSDCKWFYEDSRKHFVEEAADNHQQLYRNHPNDHYTGTRYVNTDTEQLGGDNGE